MELISFVETLITEFGFPIACVIACAWFIAKNVERDRDESKEREDKLIQANVKASEALDKVADTIVESDKVNKELSETNRLLVEKVENKLSDIGTDISKVLDKLEHAE